jgi:hypothetical protein
MRTLCRNSLPQQYCCPTYTGKSYENSKKYPEIVSIRINPFSAGTSVEYQLKGDPDFDEWAADWNRVPGRWTTSVKMAGAGHSPDLFENLQVSSYQALLIAYGLDECEFPLEKIVSISPDELLKGGTGVSQDIGFRTGKLVKSIRFSFPSF